MNDDVQKLLVRSLAAAVEEKRMLLLGLGMMNVASDPAERMRQSMDYAQAQSELMNAENALRAALTGS